MFRPSTAYWLSPSLHLTAVSSTFATRLKLSGFFVFENLEKIDFGLKFNYIAFGK